MYHRNNRFCSSCSGSIPPPNNRGITQIPGYAIDSDNELANIPNISKTMCINRFKNWQRYDKNSIAVYTDLPPPGDTCKIFNASEINNLVNNRPSTLLVNENNVVDSRINVSDIISLNSINHGSGSVPSNTCGVIGCGGNSRVRNPAPVRRRNRHGRR